MTYAIVEARRTHILPIAAAVEAEDGDTARAVGMSVRQGLRAMFRQSAYRRTGMIEGRPVAMWGVTGSFLDDEGEAWAALAPTARRRVTAVAREAAAEIIAIMATRRVIRSSVLCRDARALRFAQWLGFEVEGDVGVNGVRFFQATLRRA